MDTRSVPADAEGAVLSPAHHAATVTPRYGLTLPIFNELASPRLVAELAEAAEESGWDGVFVWDHVYYHEPVESVADPWVVLAAVAMSTSSVAIGPMVTPLARRRPHVVARQIASLDLLAGGRVVLGVGLGADSSGGEFERFGEVEDIKSRTRRYDEALELLAALLTGSRVDHRGEFYTASDVVFSPPPVRRVPIWVAARWPNKAPIRRAARYDGLYIIDLVPDDLPSAINVALGARTTTEAIEVVVQVPPGSGARRWTEAGATWCLAGFDPFAVSAAHVRHTIEQLNQFKESNSVTPEEV